MVSSIGALLSASSKISQPGRPRTLGSGVQCSALWHVLTWERSLISHLYGIPWNCSTWPWPRKDASSGIPSWNKKCSIGASDCQTAYSQTAMGVSPTVWSDMARLIRGLQINWAVFRDLLYDEVSMGVPFTGAGFRKSR